ncbi:MAG TPA: 50S ribosomal protein L11 methyltransferase [Steroidobacteraceae bacterium]|nr:50S ribosomal protein L11 methyltransferase [Steroidobacteraceae bacterium]
MDAFLQLSFDLGPLDAQAVEDVCFGQGASAVTFVDAQDHPVLEPLPGEFRLWPATRVQALFAPGTRPRETANSLSAALSLPPSAVESRWIEDRAWEREWLRDFHAMRFGRRLWICPHHEEVTAHDAAIVRLDPGLAFGTGTHPTTALCLTWLDSEVAGGDRVIDFGCGSGVLALAAVKLGAQAAHCFDIDPQALLATRENAGSNDMLSCIHIHDCAQTLPTGVDVLVANILSGPLCELAERFSSLVRPGGRILLAGLLAAEGAEVTQAYNAWFDMRSCAEREGWVSLAGKRRT